MVVHVKHVRHLERVSFVKQARESAMSGEAVVNCNRHYRKNHCTAVGFFVISKPTIVDPDPLLSPRVSDVRVVVTVRDNNHTQLLSIDRASLIALKY